jgi:hypothetical protein
MPANLSLVSQPKPQPILDWNQDTILEKVIGFLHQKGEALKVVQNLKDSVQKTGYYSTASISAAKKVKDVAEKSRKEMETLSQQATKFFKLELEKDPLSEQTKRLAEIVSITDCGVEYFTSVINNVDSPSSLDHFLRNAWLLNNKILPWTLMFSASAFLLRETHVVYPNSSLPTVTYIASGTSLVTCVACKAIRYLKEYYVDTPRVQHAHAMKEIFEKALSSATTLNKESLVKNLDKAPIL